MKRILFSACVIIGCNAYSNYNSNMNDLLIQKKSIEVLFKDCEVHESKYREITGYNEIYDSIETNRVYPHPELVDSIAYLKIEKDYLKRKLEEVKYSIDSLSKLK